MKTLVAPSKIVGQFGNQLHTTFFLFDKAIANQDAANLLDYERMVDTDETVAAGLDFMILCVLNKMDEYRLEGNPQITAFVNECLESMKGQFGDTCRDILSSIWAGYSGTEIIWKPLSGKIVPDYLATYHPRTVYFNVDRQTGQLAEDPLMQWRWFDGSPVTIPRNKSIIYTHNGRFGNPYGTSQLKRVRKNWLLKDPVLKMWVNGVDKYGTPLVAAIVPDGDIRDPDDPGNDDNPRFISNVEHMSRMIANLQNGTGLAMSAGMGEEKAEVKIHGAGAGIGDAFERLVLYLNKMIFRGLLVPSLMFDEGQKSGSYALGQSHFDVYNLMLDGIYKSFTETLIEQFIRVLIELNFGPQKDYGEFPQRKVSEEDKKKLSDVFDQMTNAGYLKPENEEHLHYVQTSLEFPLTKSEDAQKRRDKLSKDYDHYLRGDPSDGQGEGAGAKVTA